MKTARSSTDNIRVSCRFRPLTEKEKKFPLCVDFEGSDSVVCRQSQSPAISSAEDSIPSFSRTYKYAFSRVYLPDTAQKTIYADVARPIVRDVMSGYNGSVFAYGQTGSGKTHSMFGAHALQSRSEGNHSFCFHSKEDVGIVPRAARDIFQYIHNADDSLEFEIRLFFIEVYMERVRDLLTPTDVYLHVREDTALNHFYVEGCEMPFVTSSEELMDFVSAGLCRRATATTAHNNVSSRSHCVLNITVKVMHHAKNEATVGKLYFVDLAGSERASSTQAAGMQLEETKLINRSLTTLSHVISSLSEKQTFVPYRDSKLTCILKDSLGGNSRTALLVCCSPSVLSDHKTISSLRFGVHAQNVCNRAVVNRQGTVEKLKSFLDLAKQEIQVLRSQLISVSSSRTDTEASVTSVNAPTFAGSEANTEDNDAEVFLPRCEGNEWRDTPNAHAEVKVLRKALRDAKESARRLRRKNAEQSSTLQLFRDACVAWEEEHEKVSRELLAHPRYNEHCDHVLQESGDERLRIAQRMREYVEQMRAARIRAEEQNKISSQSHCSCCCSASHTERGITASSVCSENCGKESEQNKPMKENGNDEHKNNNNNNKDQNRNKDSGALGEVCSADAFSQTQTRGRLCPHRSGETLGVQTDDPCVREKSKNKLETLDICEEKRNDETCCIGYAKQAMPVERSNAAMDEIERLRHSSGALSLELRLAEKKLSNRHERIEALEISLRRRLAEKQALQCARESERAAHQAQLREAKSDALYWRHVYKELLSTGYVRRRMHTPREAEHNGGAFVLEGIFGSAKRDDVCEGEEEEEAEDICEGEEKEEAAEEESAVRREGDKRDEFE